MALVLADRVRDTTTTTGTGTVTLSGTAPTGYQNFSVVGNNNTTYYTINAGSQWEVGIGTYSTTGPSLSRDTVLSSSSAGALVNFSAGTKDVFITYPSGESVYQDGSAIKAGSAILAVPNGGTGATTLTANGVLYGNGTSAVAATAAGTTGQVLVGNTGAAPSWSAASSVGVTSIGFGTTGLEPFVATKGDIVVTGTLAASSGGTGATTLASGYLLKGNGTSAVSASVVYDTGTNVGIGTASPSNKLDVFGTSSTTMRSYSTGTASSTYAAVHAGTGEGVNSVMYSYQSAGWYGLTTNHPMLFMTNNSERMRLDSSGNVGIGTSSPSYKLDVSGVINTNAAVRMTPTNVGGFTRAQLQSAYNLDGTAASVFTWNYTNGGGELDLFINRDGGGVGGLKIYDFPNTSGNPTNILTVEGGGNVGIGTTSPAAKLHVKVSSDAIENYPTGTWASRIVNAADASTYNGLVVGNRWAADTSTVFEAGSIYGGGSAWASYYKLTGIGTHIWGGGVNGTEFMRLTSSGSLGLGTSAPSSIIHAVASGAELRAQNTNTGQYFSGRVRLKGPAGTYRSTQLVHGNDNAGGTNTYFAIESSDSSDNYQSTLAVYSYSNQAWLFHTNNNERMRIDSSGNVGIGTSSPQARLHTDNASSFTQLAVGGSALVAGINFRNSVYTNGYIYYDNGASMNFQTNGSEKMRIDFNGNVGIGTTAPQSKMEIRATSGGSVFNALTLSNYVGASVNTGVALYFDPNGAGTLARAASIQSVQATSGNYADLRFFTSNSDTPAERMRIAANGNIGVNTTTPSTNFEINGGLIAGSENRQTHPPTGPVGFKAQWNYTGGSGETDFYNLYSVASDSFRFYQTTGSGTAQLLYDIQPSTHLFYTGGTERMRIDSAGSVGIGTSSPQCIFNVKTGTAWVQNYSGSAASPSETVDWPVPAITATSYGNFTLQTMMAFALPNDGNYFTGDSVWTLRLEQTASSTTSAGVQGMRFIGPGYLSLGAGQNERMRITSGGDVGIGASSPSGKLHVESTSTGDTIYIAANTGGTAGQSVYVIPVRTAGTLRGGLQWNGTNLLYNNSSDARLKDNVADADDAASLIDAIQVRKFDWKESGSHQRYGFIAQELVEVAPEAVHQPEDAEEMMGVDYSKLVPMLVKEVQSLRARVAELEGK